MFHEIVVLLFIFLIALIGKNDLVATAGALLFVMKFSPLSNVFPFLTERGIELGILLLTLSVLTPFAAGDIMPRDLLSTLKSPAGLIAVFSGIVASYLTGHGVELLRSRPEVMVGLIVGSIIGASFLKGVPAGPLVAAGLAAVLIKSLNL
ncbi:DUF441 domain-containing protein [Natranaerobius thermophilus]|uniref:UPF0756 membrane protein Nther_1957 n=1 Tax=Natranaerobius thermophilus (strain ATCC BAA-1301 / DSM 18059 / JW/NM-WN-LF) TaxID=457570 RepID=Y1957_NATTJ|nr:DUF441 domain-containing protein [Natranaerobius thermophilus]B2A6J4.1 RecName: Full=UPF0756 membrane protein Nther_1957 [Natranaerobius thermophilus JW/NM-WN-LF]ACB85527.1 protein of unknown function DUF441 [Natranaerobius thermophilus JW/NM-WN-LF]